MNKNKIGIFLFGIVAITIYLYQLLHLNVNLDSLCDEGYLFLRIQAAQNGEIEGVSQWSQIINRIFGNIISHDILSLRYVLYFVHLLTVCLFSLVSMFYLSKKLILRSIYDKLYFILFVFLYGTIAIGGIVVSYNQLQEFFIVCVISSFLLCDVYQHSKQKYLYLLLIGFFSFLSILTILPSGILIFGSVLILIFIHDFKKWKTNFTNISVVVIGFFFSMLIFHYFVVDLFLVLEKMTETAKTVTTTDRGYDPFTFLLKIIFYFRDFYIHFCVLTGITVFALIIQKYYKKNIAYIFFLFSILVVSIYLKKPALPLTTLLAFPIIFLLMVIFINKINTKSFKSYIRFDNLFIFFLLFAPLLSSIGTNVSLASKMGSFILPWSLLMFIVFANSSMNNRFFKEIKFLQIFILLIISIPQLYTINFKNDKFFFNKINSPVSTIQISQKQKMYFENVYKIMTKYHYKPRDTVFSTQLDFMTIVALSATPCGVYFQPMDFLKDVNKDKLHKPDYLFLTQFDLEIIGEELKKRNWGFPDEFDKYSVGTPEMTLTSYSTTRTLYCRKKSNIIQ